MKYNERYFKLLGYEDYDYLLLNDSEVVSD